MAEGIVEEGFSPFFPPDRMTLGQIFFAAAVYGYVLSESANLISDGSELLLLVPRLAPVVGSIVLPVLGAVPDGLMVMFSGCGDIAQAQKKVSVGVGALAGSTIMLLTLPWFIAVFFGRVNVAEGECTYKARKDQVNRFEKLTAKPFLQSLTQTGVGISAILHQNAKIMLMSTFGYVIVQVPALFVDKTKPQGIPKDALLRDQREEANDERWFAFAGVLVCFVEFALYLKTQWEVSDDDDGHVEDAIATMTVKAMKGGTLSLQGAIAQFRNDSGFGSILEDGTDINEAMQSEAKQSNVKRMCQILAPFFAVYDINGDNAIDFQEFRMIFKDIRCNVGKATLRGLFEAADISHMGTLSFEEFAACIMTLSFYPDGTFSKDEGLSGARQISFTKDDAWNICSQPSTNVPKVLLEKVDSGLRDDESNEGSDDDDDDEAEDMPEEFQDLDPAEQQRRILLRSFTMMGIGTFLVVIFSDPIVDVFYEMAIRLDINPFYVSFILAPLASNSSEMISAYNYAKKRTQKSINTALSTLEGAAVMNNTFVLGVFYALIFARGLAWEFTAETLSTVLIQVAIGAMVLTRKAMTLLDACIILSLYIVAMALVAVLEAMGID